MSCEKISIGDLRQTISIERRSDIADGGGGFTSSKTTIATMRAVVRPKSLREKVQAEQLEALSSYNIIVRYNATSAAILHDDTVKYGTKSMNIIGVRNIDERNRFIEIEAVESAEAAL